MKNRFISTDPDDYHFEFHDTYDEAVKYLLETVLLNNDGNYSEEFMKGRYQIFELVGKSCFIEKEFKKDFCQCNSEDECNCDLEQWPYSDDIESAGTGIIKEENIYIDRIKELEDALKASLGIIEEQKICPNFQNVTNQMLNRDWKSK